MIQSQQFAYEQTRAGLLSSSFGCKCDLIADGAVPAFPGKKEIRGCDKLTIAGGQANNPDHRVLEQTSFGDVWRQSEQDQDDRAEELKE